MESFDLYKNYEFEGFWWVEGESSKFPGKLKLSPDEIELQIYGDCNESLAFVRRKEGEETKIFGKSVDGKLFTIFDAIPAGHTRYGHTKEDEHYATARVVANYCFIGQHISNPDQAVLSDLYINFPHLENWFKHSPYKRDWKSQEGSGVIEEMKTYDTGHLIDADIPALKTKLQSFHALSFSGRFFVEYHSECTAFLIFMSGHEISARDASTFAYDITGLWSLLTGVHIAPRHLFFRKIDEDETGRNANELFIYVPIRNHAHIENTHPADLLLDFEDLKGDIGKIVDKWFVGKEKMRAARSLFFRSFRKHRIRQYDISQFLNYVTILEIMGRDSNPEMIISKNDAKSLRDEISKIIEKKYHGTIQNRLKSRLDHIHEPALREKIDAIAVSLSPKTRNFFRILDDDYIGRIVKTRNYFTHYGEDTPQSKLISEDELFEVVDQLGILTMLLMLKNLGVDEEKIMERFCKVREYLFSLRRGEIKKVEAKAV